MYKYSTKDLPNAFNDYFTKRSNIHCYKIRHVNDLNLIRKERKKERKNFLTILYERLVPFFGFLLIKKNHKLKNRSAIPESVQENSFFQIMNSFFLSSKVLCFVFLSCSAFFCGYLDVM